MNKPY